MTEANPLSSQLRKNRNPPSSKRERERESARENERENERESKGE